MEKIKTTIVDYENENNGIKVYSQDTYETWEFALSDLTGWFCIYKVLIFNCKNRF